MQIFEDLLLQNYLTEFLDIAHKYSNNLQFYFIFSHHVCLTCNIKICKLWIDAAPDKLLF